MKNFNPDIRSFLSQSLLHKVAIAVTGVWVLVQVILLFVFWGAPQGSDQGMYMQMALENYMKNGWYPVKEDLYAVFIWAPGYINYLILQLKIFGTLNYNSVLNLGMNLAMLAEVFVLAKHFFSERTALYAVILYCALYSNSMVILAANTEVPFMFLILSSFVILINNHRANHFVWMGLLLVSANWIRPFAIIFLVVFVIYMIWRKYGISRYINLLLGLAAGVLMVGFYTQGQIGHFSIQSTTSGNNLIQTAHDKAYGGIMTSIASDNAGPMYIKNASRYTVFQKDSIWTSRSLIWIKSHPGRYAYLFVKKWGGLYLEDSWADRPLTGQQGSVNAYVVKSMDREVLIHRFFWMGVKSITYYAVLLLFLVGLWMNRRNLFSPVGLLFLILLMGTAANCLFVVGPRYHYPYMFVLVMFAADALSRKIPKKLNI